MITAAEGYLKALTENKNNILLGYPYRLPKNSIKIKSLLLITRDWIYMRLKS